MRPVIQFQHSTRDFYILILISIITIMLVLTFNLGKDSDTLEYETHVKIIQLYILFQKYVILFILICILIVNLVKYIQKFSYGVYFLLIVFKQKNYK